MHPFPGQFDGFFAGNAVDVDSDDTDCFDKTGNFRFGVDAGTVFVAQQPECRDLILSRFHEMSLPEYNHATEI